MGVVCKFHCPSCQQSWEIYVGSGMMSGVFERVIKVFSEDIQRSIIKEMPKTEDFNFKSFNFQEQAALCRHCQDIVTVPVFYLLKSKKTYVGGCPQCKGEAERFQEDSSVKCPRCGHAFLNMQMTGLWD